MIKFGKPIKENNMAKLKWTIDLKMNDMTVINVPYSMEVERTWSEVVLQPGKEERNVTLPDRGKLVLLKVSAKNARKDTVQLTSGRKQILLNKPVLYTNGIKGISGANQDAVEMLSAKPNVLRFTNTSQGPVSIEIEGAWQVSVEKKKVAKKKATKKVTKKKSSGRK